MYFWAHENHELITATSVVDVAKMIDIWSEWLVPPNLFLTPPPSAGFFSEKPNFWQVLAVHSIGFTSLSLLIYHIIFVIIFIVYLFVKITILVIIGKLFEDDAIVWILQDFD